MAFIVLVVLLHALRPILFQFLKLLPAKHNLPGVRLHRAQVQPFRWLVRERDMRVVIIIIPACAQIAEMLPASFQYRRVEAEDHCPFVTEADEGAVGRKICVMLSHRTHRQQLRTHHVTLDRCNTER